MNFSQTKLIYPKKKKEHKYNNKNILSLSLYIEKILVDEFKFIFLKSL